METLGDPEILKLHKTAFLCSRRYPAEIVPKAYEWAIAQRDAGKCVISGFHSQIEKDVFHFLLKGTQPIIVALARGLPKRIDGSLIAEVEKGRLLIVSPFDESVRRASIDTAFRRNQFMIEVADEVMVAYATKDGMLEQLVKLSIKINSAGLRKGDNDV